MVHRAFLIVLYGVAGVYSACTCDTTDGGFSKACVARGPCTGCISASCTNWLSPIQCSSGSYNTGAGLNCLGVGGTTNCSLGTCLPCSCGVGSNLITCDSIYTDYSVSGMKNFECGTCTKPSNAYYTTQNSCDWQCNIGSSGSACTACTTVCTPGTYLSGYCSQTVNAISDQSPTCRACTNVNVLSYSSACIASQCVTGYILSAGTCVQAPSPPSPPLPPPSPPSPPPPPSPPVRTPTYKDCPNNVVGHWFGVTPATLGLIQIDSSGNGNDIYITGTAVGDGSTYAQSSGSKYFGSSAGLSFKLSFKVTLTSTYQTIFQLSDTSNTSFVTLGIDGTDKFFIEAKTAASSVFTFTNPVALVTNTQYNYIVNCGPYLSFCYTR